MSDAAVDRLARLISDRPTNNPDNKDFRSRRPPLEIHLGLAEGWFSLVLLAIVVYSTIWSVQAAGWVDHLSILTLTTALGLIIGVIAAKQKRFPRLYVHLIALGFGLLLASWQTAGAFYQGNTGALVTGMQHWFSTALTGGTGDDNSIFLFFITTLGFVLAYTSAWLVYRTRSPWLMIVANAVVLLINLSNVDAAYAFFLVVFLMAALLLLLRFNLYESVRRWRKQGLRYADDVGWDVMQAGAIISVGILIFSWILPGGYTNETAAQIWNANSNPWTQLENTWNRVIAVNGGANPSNHGNFRDSLVLGGNPNLNHDVVFTVDSSDHSIYLQSLGYETYTKRGWANGPTDTTSWKANDAFPSSAVMTHPLEQKISVVNPPGEQYPYIFGASDLGALNAPANVLTSKASGAVVAWLGKNGNLAAGAHYTVVSYVSSADIGTLRGVPMPANSAPYPSGYDGPPSPNVYDQSVVDTYTQLPSGLDPRILAKAKDITAKNRTMYDKVVALEQFFRSNYTYSTDIQLPAGKEGVSWFLFDSDHKGFCNYFSTSMTVMARELGIPARVVNGYTNGQYDEKTHQLVIRGTDAHSWTQVYFAGYGWINFEPSANFTSFTRPLPNQFPSAGINGANGTNPGGSVIPPNSKGRTSRGELGGSDSGQNSTVTAAQAQVQLRQQIGAAVGSFILLILFGALLFTLWWRRLFRRYGLATQLYGRMCVLGDWAGIQIKPSQTPYEYVHGISESAPHESITLERLGDIYVRDKWADPESIEHPRRSGEIEELPGIWKHLQPRLFLYVLRHPSFLRWLPQKATALFVIRWKRVRARKGFEEEL